MIGFASRVAPRFRYDGDPREIRVDMSKETAALLCNAAASYHPQGITPRLLSDIEDAIRVLRSVIDNV